MPLSEVDLVSRRKQARQMRSKMRSQEYRNKRRKNFMFMWLSLILMIGAPLLFYGGIEYGYFHKPASTEFNMYTTAAWLVCLFTFSRTWSQQNKYQESDDLLLKLEMETPGLDDEDASSAA